MREFIYKEDAKTKEKFDELMENPTSNLKRELKKLIKKDPYCINAYSILYERAKDLGNFNESEKILNEAYEKAIELVTNKGEGWPDEMHWGYLENRPIMQLILVRGIRYWEKLQTEDALEIFRNLLKVCPNDNLGVRDYILAIRMNMSFEDFEKRFNKGGYYDMDLIKWFDENVDKFPDEFDWWKKKVEDDE